jgi:hypothetical protein
MRHTHPLGAGYSLRENGLWLSDNTIGDVSTSRHGLTPKAPNDVSKFLRGDGTWAVPGTSPGAVDPLEFTNRFWVHQVAFGGNSYESLFMPGGATLTGSTAADSDDDGIWIRNLTGAVSGNSAVQAFYSAPKIRRDWLGIYVARIKTYTSVADIRVWTGMFTNTPVATSDPTGHLAAFRYDTSADGTAFWRTCTKDGTTLNATATSVAVTADTMYLLWIKLLASSVEFYINQSLVNTHTTNLPGGNTDIGPGNHVTTLTNAAKGLRYNRQWGSYRG